ACSRAPARRCAAWPRTTSRSWGSSRSSRRSRRAAPRRARCSWRACWRRRCACSKGHRPTAMLADDRIVGSVERVFHLKKAPMTGTLPPHLLAALAEATRPRVFRKGEMLMREGERVAANYFVIEGRLALWRGGRLLDRAEPGAAIGALGILANTPSPIDASAEIDTLTLELDADTCFDLLEDHFGILRHFLREIT